jgi:hypothetical protein
MHNDRGNHCIALAAIALACVALVSCSSGTRYIVNEQQYMHDGQNLVPAGSGCSDITLPGSGGADNTGPRAGDFNFAEGADGDSYLVRVFSNQVLLVTRRYDEATLASGRVDEFSVTTQGGAVYTLRYWGGPCTAMADASAE